MSRSLQQKGQVPCTVNLLVLKRTCIQYHLSSSRMCVLAMGNAYSVQVHIAYPLQSHFYNEREEYDDQPCSAVATVFRVTVVLSLEQLVRKHFEREYIATHSIMTNNSYKILLIKKVDP